MPEEKIVDVKQYWYDKFLQKEILASFDRFVDEYRISPSRVVIFVRDDEVVPADDFGDLNVVRLTKGLQPHHFQIGPIPKREPIIFTGERKPYE
jgi:hypothetical protein